MRIQTLTHLILSNAHLKIISCIIGYGFWFLLSQSHYAVIQQQIPLCFYNVTDAQQIKHPETIMVTLTGKRSDLRTLDLNALAVHIDGSRLAYGESPLPITEKTLFLPSYIKLVNYYPANASITVGSR